MAKSGALGKRGGIPSPTNCPCAGKGVQMSFGDSDGVR